jgi:hypothetical protein
MDGVKSQLKMFEKVNYPDLDGALDGLSALLKDASGVLTAENVNAVLKGFVKVPASALLWTDSSASGLFDVHSSWKHDAPDADTIADSAKDAVEMIRDVLKFLDKAAETSGYGSLAQSSWVNEMLGGIGVLNPLHALPPYKGVRLVLQSTKLCTEFKIFRKKIFFWC